MPDIKCPATATAVLACTFVLSGTGALAQGNNAYRGIDTVAGKSHRLGVCGNVQKDCTSGPPPAIRVVVPPKHGELNVRSGNLKAGRITRCPNLRATAQGVFYQSKPKSVEDDADGDRLPCHSSPDRGNARSMDQEKGDHLRIDNVVVVMIPVWLRGRYCRIHFKLGMA
jgi:hypothetical protein